MAKKWDEFNVAGSIGGNNSFLIKQGANVKRVRWNTIKASAESAGSAAGAAAGSVAGAAAASAVAQTVGSAAGSAAAQAVVGATSAALRDDITSIRIKHTSVADIAIPYATSTWVDQERAATSAALRDDITSIRTKHTSVATKLANTSAALRDDITSVRLKHTSVATQLVTTSTDLRDDITSVRTKHTSVASQLVATSAALRGDVTSIDPTWVHVSSLNSGDKRLQGYINDTGTTGIIAGGAMSSVGPGLVYCSAARFFVRNANDPNAQIMFASIAGTSVSVVDGAANFLYASYNAGTPQWIQSPTPLADVYQNVIVGVVYRDGNSLHLSNVNVPPGQVGQKLARRLALVNGVTRQSGLATAETGTRNISITAGTVWLALTTYSLAAFDSSGADRFSYFYSDGSGGFTEVTSQAAIDNTQYDDGSGTLATLSNNQYGVHWVYKTIDGETLVVYGTDTYTLTEAENATTPASLPLQITGLHAILCSKIIIKKSAATFTDIESAFDTVFSPGVASDHGDLGGLQGGTTDEYYHLTSAQLTEYTSITGVVSKQDNVLSNAILTSTDATSTRGFKLSVGQGLTFQEQGSPGSGQAHLKWDMETFASCTVADWGQRGHSQIVVMDALSKEKRMRVSSFASVALSIAHGLTKKDTGQIITGGALVSVYDIGDVSTGTHTLDYGLRPMQAYNNMGAHTLAPDTQTGYVTMIISNSTGAGAITTSGWVLVDGDAFDTSVGSHFICYAQTTENDGANYSHLNVKAMQ